ncbi:hypothetical protein [Crossiella cryophila]|uniref:Uncharacterized protein n=1 Tax=Crossiella cryophila TaxID=43355 RepID=A0A7W7FX68_9PSEU|nr:hypothetical protein [Crossiella cryophila]MBB4678609.1 hypothetical protein [Crossiella cryophila]
MMFQTGEAIPPTMAGYGELAVRRLCQASGLAELETQAVDGYRIMTESWGQRRIEDGPPWSILTPDSTPIEYSVLLQEEPVSVRVAIEALADPPSPEGYWSNAQRMTARLAETYGLYTEHLHRIEHLFAPRPGLRQPMVALHVMGWSRTGAPEGKIYLCVPRSEIAACGPIYDEALTRLGFPGQWQRIAQALHPDDVVPFFSLDLSDAPSARTKVYVQHRGRLTAQRLERFDRLAANPQAGAGPALARIANRAEQRSVWAPGASPRTKLQWRSNSRRYWSADTYVALVHGRSQPIDTVLHQFALPTRCRNDAESDRMVHEVLDAFAVSDRSRAAYTRCVQSLIGPDPAKQMYNLTYVSARHDDSGTPRVAVYFNPRMFHPEFGLTNGDLAQTWRFQGMSVPRTEL